MESPTTPALLGNCLLPPVSDRTNDCIACVQTSDQLLTVVHIIKPDQRRRYIAPLLRLVNISCHRFLAFYDTAADARSNSAFNRFNIAALISRSFSQKHCKLNQGNNWCVSDGDFSLSISGAWTEPGGKLSCKTTALYRCTVTDSL